MCMGSHIYARDSVTLAEAGLTGNYIFGLTVYISYCGIPVRYSEHRVSREL